MGLVAAAAEVAAAADDDKLRKHTDHIQHCTV